MKCKLAVLLPAVVLAVAINPNLALAQRGYAVVERGPDWRVWESTNIINGTNAVHRYTECATGIFYTNSSGQMVESKEEIDVLPNGTAEAVQGRHQATFPGDIYQGTIQVVTPDGLTLQSRPLGLFYDDGTNTVLIAQLQDSQGAVLGANQVIYTNAFTGVVGDLVYSYRRGGFSQDIVIRQQLPPPENYGLSSKTARLQILSEFFNTADPTQTVSPLDARDGLTDSTLTFGQMKMMRGKAVSIGNAAASLGETPAIPVYKSWQHLQGRTFLVEEVPYRRIAPQLAQLPAQASTSATNPILPKVAAMRLLPSARPVPTVATPGFRLAQANFEQPRGVVLDYNQVDTDQGDFEFASGQTYFISGGFNLNGTATFDAGTVLKFPEDEVTGIACEGNVVCGNNPYSPTVFTSMNDDSVGDPIEGSSGSPATGVNDYITVGPGLADCQFYYAGTAVTTSYSFGFYNSLFNDVEFYQCTWGIEQNNDVTVANSLVSGCWIFCDGGDICDNVTFDNSYAANDQCSQYHNCVFSSMANIVYDYWGLDDGEAPSGNNNGFDNTGQEFGNNVFTFDGTYQTGPLGNYYLPSDSPFIDAGNTTADQVGLYWWTTQTNQQIEGTSIVDLGYHYPALDGNGNPISTEVSGVPDYISDANGNGLPDLWELANLGSLSYCASDLDGAGNTLLYDYQNGVNPTNASNVLLGYWPFDNTNTWVGAEGQLPLVATNIVGVPSWSTNAVLIDSTNPALLCYRDVETNGNANINLRCGTVRFWFKPDWSSEPMDGNGPQDQGGFIEMGNQGTNTGWWALLMDTNGDTISLITQTNGVSMTNLTASIAWNSGGWHQLVLTYDADGSSLYVDGQDIADGLGVQYWPNQAERSAGFCIGSDNRGNNQAGGTFDELETFNYPLAAADITNGFTPVPQPTVTITYPTSGKKCFVDTNQSLSITVDAEAPAGRTIQEVDYSYILAGHDPVIGVSTSYPFSIVWTNSDWTDPYGDYDYQITAVAIDNTGVASSPTNASVFVELDSDNDGIPDWWMLEYFGHPTGEASDNSLANDDANNDGISNLEAYQDSISPIYLPNLAILSGTNQFGSYGAFLPAPVVIQATYDSGGPWANSVLTLAVTNGTALLAATTNDTPATSLSLPTDTNGTAAAWVYFPPAGPGVPDSTIVASVSAGLNTNAITINEYVPLAHWTFDDVNTWVGDEGQLPILTNNLIGVPSWSSNAVLIDNADSAELSYLITETNGDVNLNCQSGSVLFYFKPDWSSEDQGGTGPGTSGRLVEIGDYNPAFTNGWWSLYFSADGTQLYFATSTNGVGMTNLDADVSLTSNEWYQIALTYSPDNTTLFLDGQSVAAGGGVVYYPNADECKR